MNPITIFTDGACDGDGYGGWAWYAAGGRWASGAYWPTTNNRMELQACIAVLAAPFNGGAPIDPERPVRLVCDSAYVVNCFRDRWYEGWRRRRWLNSKNRPVENRDLWETLIESVEGRETLGAPVSWVHVRGHGRRATDDPGHVAGNAEADRLAVAARIELRRQADARQRGGKA